MLKLMEDDMRELAKTVHWRCLGYAQDLLSRVWDEFDYRLDFFHALQIRSTFWTFYKVGVK